MDDNCRVMVVVLSGGRPILVVMAVVGGVPGGCGCGG